MDSVKAEEKGYQVYFDILNILACFFVVLMHCTDKRLTVEATRGWYISVILQSIAIWAVPIFFMLTGATLLDYRKRYDTKTFLQKRFLRVVVPFVAWSLIYAVWKQCTGQIEIESVFDLVARFLDNKIIQIFWFFYRLIPGYLCIVFLSIIVELGNKKMIFGLFAMGLFNTSIIPFVAAITGLNIGQFSSPLGGSTLVFFMLGWILKHETFTANTRRIIYIAGILSSAILFCTTSTFSLACGEFDTTFMTSGSLFAIILAGSIFVFVKHLRINERVMRSKRALKLVKTLSGLSFGIYLIHKIPMYYLNQKVDPFQVRYMILGSIFIYVVTAIVVYLLKRVPFIKSIIP